MKIRSFLIQKAVALLITSVVASEEVRSLSPLVLSGKKINAYKNLSFGANSALSIETIAAVPGGTRNYQDLFALISGAYSGNPSTGTFSLR
ncbi:MAG: hypothetical protein ACO3RV_06620, partial [Luteolibacter sp.]